MASDESANAGTLGRNCRRWLPAGLAVGMALMMVVGLAVQFYADSRGLWNGIVHDRNSHAQTALRLARAVERGDGGDAIVTILRCKVWPPLHGIVAAGGWVIGGRDWRALVLPSLLGWVLAVSCAGLLASRLVGAAAPGWLAALVAAGLTAQSPSHRAFATDVMLESLGAGLSMAVLWLFAQALRAEKPAGWWRATALALTLLFFEKYNYWLIVATALGFTWLSIQYRPLLAWLAALPWGTLARRELRQPLNWLALVTSLAVAGILVSGLKSVDLAGQRISLHPPNNLLTLAYAFLFARVAVVVYSTNWRPPAPIASALWQWHIVPVAISFLFPQRLGAFLGFLSLGNFGDAPVRPFPGNVIFYAGNFLTDYHAVPALALVALALTAVAWWQRRGDPAMRAVMVCFLLGGALMMVHPNQKSRFMHSWMPALWVSAGAGAACLCGLLPRRIAPLGGVVAAGALVLVCAPAWMSRGFSSETGNQGETASLLDLSDGWMQQLPAGVPVAFLATQECQGWTEWTFLQRFADRKKMIWLHAPPPPSPADLAARLAAKGCEWMVAVEVPPDFAGYTKAGDIPAARLTLAAWDQDPQGWRVVWQGREQGITARVWRQMTP